VIVCGLAGSLTDELPPGSVVIPQRVALASGASFDCDARLVERLVAAARGLALEPSLGALVTGPSILTGPARQAWAARGFVAADMESALLAERGSPLGVVRVIVDSPGVELSALWLRPVRACLRPWLWPQALRLALTAPGYAMVAARVAARVLAAPAS
jgi:4-hydroxy-3-methylbut-2-enyl diphosphate reductase